MSITGLLIESLLFKFPVAGIKGDNAYESLL